MTSGRQNGDAFRRPGVGQELLDAHGLESIKLAAAPRRGFCLTFPKCGDVEAEQVYSYEAVSLPPMVTWFPAGAAEDRFCLIVLAQLEQHNQRLLWLVSDIPGSLPDSAPAIEPCCYGLAGNY